MTKVLTEFKQLWNDKQKSSTPIQTEWAEVKEVDWEDKTMTCIGQNNGLEYFDILLGLGSIYKKPKIGSMVLVGSIDNSEEGFMIDCEEFEEVLIVSGQSEFTINTEGFIVKKGDESLKEVMNDLIAQINALNLQLQKVVVSAGVTPDVPALQEIVQETNTIKQRLNTIIR